MPYLYENTKQNFSSFDEFKEVATKTLNEIYGRVKPLDVVDFSQNATHYKATGYYNEEKIPKAQPVGEPQSDEAKEAEDIARASEEENKRKAAEEVAEELRLKAKFTAKEPVSYEDLVLATNLGIEVPKEITDQLAHAVKKGHMAYEAAAAAGLKEIDGVPILEAAKNARTQAVVNQDNTPVPDVNEEVAAQNAVAAKAELPSAKNLPYNVKQVGNVTISDKALEFAESKGVDVTKIIGTGRDGTIKKDDVIDYIANNAPATENANGNSDEQSNT